MSEINGGSLENSWNRWQKLIVAELERLDRALANIHTRLDELSVERTKEITNVRVEVAVLQEKIRMQAALTGSIMGTLSGIMTAIIMYAIKH